MGRSFAFMIGLKITGWNETFESADSRKREKLFWFQFPCGTESTGLIMLRRHGSRGLAAFGVFSLLCQLHASTESRSRRCAGILCRNDGRPVSIDFLADKLRIGKDDLESAVNLLSSPDVGWLQILPSADDLPSSAGHLPLPADDLPQSAETRQTNNTKQTNKAPGGATVAPLPFSSTQFVEAWEMWEQHRKEKRAKVTPTSRKQQLAKLEALGESKAIAAIRHSVANGYQGIFEPNENTIGNRNGNGRTTDRNANTCNDPNDYA